MNGDSPAVRYLIWGAVAALGIIAVVVLEVVAICHRVDGTTFAAAMSVIGAICGWSGTRIYQQVKKNKSKPMSRFYRSDQRDE
jgi:hypothetical protein